MERQGTGILLGMSAALLLFALFGAALGFFIIDEVIYVFAADTFRATGRLIVENGTGLPPSPDLEWTELLTRGPNGLTSQYPPGTAVLWAGVMSVLGDRGLILFNAAATVAAVFVTRALALRLFGDRGVALGAAVLFLMGTFVLEYAFVFWPHMPVVLCIAGGYLLFLRALDAPGGGFFAALLAGLAVGAGVLLRIDTILILPAIAIIAVLHAARPVVLLAGGAVGLAPAFAVLALANAQKFGTLNPISYGGKAGHTALSGYIPFAVVLALALAGLVLLRLKGRAVPGRWVLAGAVVAAVTVAVVPETRRLALAFLRGAGALVVDAREIQSPYTGIQWQEDGTRSFWGLSKKALGQSMPWLGVLALLVSASYWRAHRRVLVQLAVVIGVWSFPFLVRSWHGGMSSNMRYFLPLFPFLAALGALLMADLMARVPRGGRVMAQAVLAGAVLALVWTLTLRGGLFGAHQILSMWLFLGIAAVSLAAGLRPAPGVLAAALVAAGLGVGVAGFNGFTDAVVSQLRRHGGRVLSDEARGFEGRVLIYSYMLRSAMQSPEQAVAVVPFRAEGPDPVLVGAALDQGYRVLMPEGMAGDYAAAHPGLRVGAVEDAPVPVAEVLRAE